MWMIVSWTKCKMLGRSILVLHNLVPPELLAFLWHPSHQVGTVICVSNVGTLERDIGDSNPSAAVDPISTSVSSMSPETFDALLQQAHISNLLHRKLVACLGSLAFMLFFWHMGCCAKPEFGSCCAASECIEDNNPVTAAMGQIKSKNLSSVCAHVLKALPDKDFSQLKADLWNRQAFVSLHVSLSSWWFGN